MCGGSADPGGSLSVLQAAAATATSAAMDAFRAARLQAVRSVDFIASGGDRFLAVRRRSGAAVAACPQKLPAGILLVHEPLLELIREYQGTAYRIFFCVKGPEIWLLHALEKKRRKTPVTDLRLAQDRMRNVLNGAVRRTL